jgi:hypothetical protein
MANHGPSYGLDAELAAKMSAKLDPALLQEASDYVAKRTGVKVTGTLGAHLNDGTVLCALANAIQPGVVAKVNKQKMPFMKMENIQAFLNACQAWGMKPADLFQTVDLYEEKNMVAVITCLLAVKRLKN